MLHLTRRNRLTCEDAEGIRKCRCDLRPLLLAIALAAGSISDARSPAPSPRLTGTAAPSNSDVHDFDFLLGDWAVHNRLLKKRLANSHEWIEFVASDAFHALPGNLGSEENYRTEHWPNFFALGLHLYDPSTKRWTLYWGDSRNSPGTLQTLASGSFVGNVGTFYAPDQFDGTPITVRIVWTRVDQNHAHWEQAFSSDQGRSWETNWTMDFTRR